MTQNRPKMSVKVNLELLARVRLEFTPPAAAEKRRIIETFKGMPISNARQLFEYHELLCFIQAYPDDPRIVALADGELARFSERVKKLWKKRPKVAGLDDTGIVDTKISYPYNLHMARWLLRHFGDAVEIDWDAYNEKDGDPVSGMLPLFALYMENDGIDDEDLGTTDWVIRGAGGRNTLRWLVNQIDRLQIPDEFRQYMYDNAELRLSWQLGESKCARTLAKIPGREIYFQNDPIKKHRIDLRKSISLQPPELMLVPRDQGRDLIETQIRALLPRHRELYPATYANPAEVYITSPGRGLEVYIIGMEPEHRMPLESNYGALLIKNGVPIGYGISIIFFDRCEIAINIFDSFRSGEASSIFEHFVRVFYHHFGARNFLMRRWQVGFENDEGIKSGSYWFYYKLGFRSIAPSVDELAKSQWHKIRLDKNYRSDKKTLEKLALSDMHWSASGGGEPYEELSVIKLGLAVTDTIAREFDGDRGQALSQSSRLVQKSLAVSSLDWPPLERQQFERFAPMLYMTGDLAIWTDSEKNALIEIIKAKAAPTEIGYIGLLQKHRRLEAALRKIAQ